MIKNLITKLKVMMPALFIAVIALGIAGHSMPAHANEEGAKEYQSIINQQNAESSLMTKRGEGDQGFGAHANNLTGVFTMQPGGVAYEYVSQIFGEWIKSFHGQGDKDDYTVVTVVAGYSNVLALLLGVVIVSYVILAGVINTAASGQVMGQSWSTLWLPLRTAFAFGLIMPVTVNGGLAGHHVSAIQAAIVYLALVGSNAADLVWNSAVTHIGQGRMITYANAHAIEGPAKQIAYLASCGYGVDKLLTLKAIADEVEIDRDDIFAWRVEYFDGSNHTFDYTTRKAAPKGKQVKTIEFGPETTGFASFVSIGSADSCGSIRFTENETVADSESGSGIDFSDRVSVKVSIAISDATLTYIESLASDNGPLPFLSAPVSKYGLGGFEDASSALSSVISGTGTESDFQKKKIIDRATEIAVEYLVHLNEFGKTIQIKAAKAVSEDGEIQSSLVNNMTKGGWGAAGLWYFQLSKIQNIAQDHINDFYGNIEFKGKGGSCWFDNWCNDDSFKSYLLIDAIHDLAMTTGVRAEAQNRLPDIEDFKMAEFNDDNWYNGLSSAIAGVIFDITSIGANFSPGVGGGTADVKAGTGSANPFLTITAMGHAINGFVQIVIAMVVLAPVFGAAAKLIGGPIVALGKAGTSLTGSIGDSAVDKTSGIFSLVIFTLFSLLLGVGYTLAYAIPFMPVMIWTMIVIGWLLMLVEAVVSAPLAVIMMATPEGEGISGQRMERAISLISAVIMRPALSVIGLIASLAIAYVGFGIYNSFFWRAVAMNTSIGLFEIVAILVIYTTGAMTICKFSFSIIHQLPNNILEWMTSGQGRSFGENDIGEMTERGSNEAGGHIKGGIMSGKDQIEKDKGSKKNDIAQAEDRDYKAKVLEGLRGKQ